MAKYKAAIHWEKLTDQDESYTWSFENGVILQNGNASLLNKPGIIDPESAFVASIASCHMLSVFAIAAKHGISIYRYDDEAIGVLEKNLDGRIAITRVLLRPKIELESQDTSETMDMDFAALHDEANRNCFIANSVKTNVHIEPR